MSRALEDWWRGFWFPEVSSTSYGLYRASFFGLLFLLTVCLGRAPLWSWTEVDEAFWMPILITRALGISSPPAPSFEGVLLSIQLVFYACLFLSAIGLATRVSTAGVLVTGLIFYWLPHNYGKTHHGDALLVLFFVFFALAPGGRRISVDSWLRRRKQQAHHVAADGMLPENGASLRAMQVAMIFVFFAAGIAKLRAAGLDWAISDNLRTLLLRHQLSHAPPLSWGVWLAQFPVVYEAAALGVLALETLSPVMLVHRWARTGFAVALLCFQLANWLLLGVSLPGFLVCYLCWFPWEARDAWR